MDVLQATIGRAGPNTKIIPGHGVITDRKGLVAQRDLILTIRDRVAKLAEQGKTVDEVIAAKPTADFDGQIPQATQQSTERFIKWVYAEVKKNEHLPG